jgi:SAM-dependent methyltransferase
MPREDPKHAFGQLVEQGVYSVTFEHSAAARGFLEACIREIAGNLAPGRSMTVLDAGCGTGAWLDVVQQLLGERSPPVHYYGFDLTPQMIDVARRRLAGKLPPEQLQTGDALDDRSYTFPGGPRLFDLIYSYDLVQQLPRRAQFDVCRQVLKHLSPAGVAVVFDHDRSSLYGAIMGAKKLATKYLAIPLVPRFYCYARYPPLAAFARRLRATGAWGAEVRIAPDRKKRVLIMRSSSRS